MSKSNNTLWDNFEFEKAHFHVPRPKENGIENQLIGCVVLSSIKCYTKLKIQR